MNHAPGLPKQFFARVDISKASDSEAGIAHHNKQFGQYATLEAVFADPEDPAQFAFLFELHDLDGLRAATRTPAGDAIIREGGFAEQLGYYLQA